MPSQLGHVWLSTMFAALCWFTIPCKHVDYWLFVVGSRNGCIPGKFQEKMCVLNRVNKISVIFVLDWFFIALMSRAHVLHSELC